jgi:hypothetical protein
MFASIPSGSARHPWRRVAWQVVLVIAAALLAAAVLWGYRQPDFLLDLSALRLC